MFGITMLIGINAQAVDNNSAYRSAMIQAQVMNDISRGHGLVFFFRSDCPYCKQTARALKEIERRYGVEVVAATLDGAGLPEYPQYRDGRNLGDKWGVTAVPALFIADKNTLEHAPVGYGVMSLEQIIARMYQLTNVAEGNF